MSGKAVARTRILSTTMVAIACLAEPAAAQNWQGYGELAAGPDGLLFVAEPGGRGVLALALSVPAGAPTPAPYNLRDAGARLAKALDVEERALRIGDLAIGGDGRAYVSGAALETAGPRPFLARIDAGGAVTVLDVPRLVRSRVALSDLPNADLAFWGEAPSGAFAITDLLFHQGQLYVAGISNRQFASTLRRFAWPFDGRTHASTIEIYRTVHNQVETRAPIRAMTIVEIGGAPHLLAAYTCTPLALIPIEALRDGAHVRGKTIAELGYGNAPVDLLPYSVQWPGQPTEAFVLVTNTDRSADVIRSAAIAAAATRPSLTQPVQLPLQDAAGIETAAAPLGTVLQVADQDSDRLLALRRDHDSGTLELVSIRKDLYFRLTDFVNEYDFPSYAYPADNPFQQTYIRPVHGIMKQDEGRPETIR